MQFFTNNGFTTFGKYKGKFFKNLPQDYLKWATQNIEGFKEELKDARKRRKELVAKHRHGMTEPWKVQPPKPINDMPAATKQHKATKSACGKGNASFKVMRPPTPKQFTSRSKRIVGGTLD